MPFTRKYLQRNQCISIEQHCAVPTRRYESVSEVRAKKYRVQVHKLNITNIQSTNAFALEVVRCIFPYEVV